MHWNKTFCNSALTGCDTMVLFVTVVFTWKPHFPNICKRIRKTQQPQYRVCPVSPLPFLFRNHEWLSYPKLFWTSILHILLSIFHLLASDPAKICASPSTPSSPRRHHWKLINYSTLQNIAEPLSNLILGDEVFLAMHYSVHTKTTKYPARQTLPTSVQESD